MNSMYNQFGGTNGMIWKIRMFKNLLKGNTEQMLQSLVNSGQVSQEMLNQAQAMAKPLYEEVKDLI